MKSKIWSTGVCKNTGLILVLFTGILLFSTCSSQKWIMGKQEYQSFVENQKGQVLANGHHIQYIDSGSSEKVILLVHGVPTSGWLYRNMISPLVEKGYRVIVPDMLGYGNSDKPKGYEMYAPDKMGGYLLELMDSLKINNWTHVCHDAGGLWTWELVKKDSMRIEHLVLLNTIILKEGFNPPIQMKKNIFSRLYVKMYTSFLSRKSSIKATIKGGLENKELCNPNMLVGYIKPTKSHLDRALFQFFSNTYVKDLPDYKPVLQKIKCPVTVIWGKNDEILVWEKQAETVKKLLNIKDSDIHILENAKHFIQEEKPMEIVEFIAGSN